MKITKKKKEITEKIDVVKKHTLDEALEITRKFSSEKFDESLDVCIKLGIDTKKSDQAVRGVMNLPHTISKKIKIAVFAEGEDVDTAKSAGADIVGSSELIEAVKNGKIEFDKCISTPSMMAKVGILGQILGPKGLMPNPKLGTVSKDIKTAVKNVRSGQLEFKSDKGGLIHASVGKCSLSDEDIKKNIKFFYNELLKTKPASSKGIFVKEIFLSSTMGPGLKIEESSVI